MNISLAQIVNDEIINVIVVDPNWERMFSRGNGFQPLSELTGDPVIGAVRVNGNKFMPPNYETVPPVSTE